MKRRQAAILCGFFVSSLTFWKTILYYLRYACHGEHLLAAVVETEELVLWIVTPGIIWFLIPACFIVSYGRLILAALRNQGNKL